MAVMDEEPESEPTPTVRGTVTPTVRGAVKVGEGVGLTFVNVRPTMHVEPPYWLRPAETDVDAQQG